VALLLLRIGVQVLGEIHTLTDAWRVLPAVLAGCAATILLRLGWAGVRVLLASRRLTVGPDGVTLERLGLLGLGHSRRHWPPSRVGAFSVQTRRHKGGVLGYELSFRPAHTDAWIAWIFGSKEEAGMLGRLANALNRLGDQHRPAAPPELGPPPWPGRIEWRREADGAMTLHCPPPGLTIRALFPLALGLTFAGIAVAVAVAAFRSHQGISPPGWVIPPLLLGGGLTLIAWTLTLATRQTLIRADADELQVQTRSWLGAKRWSWKRHEIRPILFQGSGGRWPGGWQALFTGPSDSLAVTVDVARQGGGECTRHFLGLYWPGELLWCAEVLARSSGQ
jgi:hypothetical protein